jgi:cell division protein FtsB
LKFGIYSHILTITMFLPFLLKRIVLPGLLFYGFFSIYLTVNSIIDSSKRNDELNKQILGLKDEKKALEDKFNVINSDEFVEKEARTKLNMKKEGEDVYLIPSNEAPKTENITYIDTKTTATKASNFQKWMDLLF